MSRRPGYAVALVAALTLLLSGCGLGPGPGAEVEVVGRTFLSTGVTEDGRPRDLVAGSRVRLTFDDGQLSAQAGCNTMFAGYRVEEDVLRVDSLGGTEMGCPEELMAQDAWLVELLESGPVLALDDATLTLTGAGTVLTLLDREVADPDRPLVGPRWQVDSLVTRDAVASVPGQAEATLTFRDDGTVEILGGCNQGSAPYTYDEREGTLVVGDVVMTAMACEDERGELEDAVLGVLRTGALTVEIVGPSLTLTAGDRGLGLRAGEDGAGS
ncbi:META domain-containing protein [Ornithinimicrobium flavum]|uniref:META domain-containing protein n=1 Tax=Ornithinimicrobium flavum TaxID=1288636 RepID=UPI00106F3CCA|nr:META domain-containing protein [Ornithinimicrobium flavum]